MNEENRNEQEQLNSIDAQMEMAQKQPKPESQGLSIAALVLGILSLVLWLVLPVSIPCAILAIIFGVMRIKKAGKGMAIAGLVTGILTICIWVAIFIFSFSVAYYANDAFGDILTESNPYYYEIQPRSYE